MGATHLEFSEEDDERSNDKVLFCGPTPASILQERNRHGAQGALDCLVAIPMEDRNDEVNALIKKLAKLALPKTAAVDVAETPAEIVVYVAAVNANGEMEMLKVLVPISELGGHYEHAESLCAEDGYEIKCSFDADEPAGRAIENNSFIEVREQNASESLNALVPTI